MLSAGCKRCTHVHDETPRTDYYMYKRGVHTLYMYIVIVQIFDEHSPRFWFIKICPPGQPENSSPPIYYIRRWLVCVQRL